MTDWVSHGAGSPALRIGGRVRNVVAVLIVLAAAYFLGRAIVSVFASVVLDQALSIISGSLLAVMIVGTKTLHLSFSGCAAGRIQLDRSDDGAYGVSLIATLGQSPRDRLRTV